MFIRSAAALAGLVAFTAAAHAQNQTSDGLSCHTQADRAVAEWANGVLEPAADSTAARPADSVLVISAGHSYLYRPVNGTDVRVNRDGIGRQARDYNRLWQAEYDSCIVSQRGIVILRY